MLDSLGRNITYMRVSVTDRCNLRCIYCMPENGVEKKCHEDIMRYEDILKVVKASAMLGIKKIRYTGGEPLILRGIDKLIYETNKIPVIEDIAITTNGILLDDMAADLKKAGLKRVNISLDTLDEKKFRLITRGGSLRRVMSAIEKCLSLGVGPVKINTVAIRGVNDSEIIELANLTKNLPVSVRFIELMPIGEGVKLYEKGVIYSDEIREMIPDLIPLRTRKGDTASMYKLKDSKGTIGFISPMSCKFCSNCNRIRLTAAGTIKPCLHSKEEVNIKEYVDNEVTLLAALKNAIYRKPAEHRLTEDKESKSEKAMYEIGG